MFDLLKRMVLGGRYGAAGEEECDSLGGRIMTPAPGQRYVYVAGRSTDPVRVAKVGGNPAQCNFDN